MSDFKFPLIPFIQLWCLLCNVRALIRSQTHLSFSWLDVLSIFVNLIDVHIQTLRIKYSSLNKHIFGKSHLYICAKEFEFYYKNGLWTSELVTPLEIRHPNSPKRATHIRNVDWHFSKENSLALFIIEQKKCEFVLSQSDDDQIHLIDDDYLP